MKVTIENRLNGWEVRVGRRKVVCGNMEQLLGAVRGAYEREEGGGSGGREVVADGEGKQGEYNTH